MSFMEKKYEMPLSLVCTSHFILVLEYIKDQGLYASSSISIMSASVATPGQAMLELAGVIESLAGLIESVVEIIE